MDEVLVLVRMKDLAFADGATSIHSVKLAALPLIGDTLVIRDGDGEWTGTVVGRTLRDSISEGPSVVINCEGRFKADPSRQIGSKLLSRMPPAHQNPGL